MDCPQDKPQKDRKYGRTTCSATAFMELVYLLIQILFFVGRAWCLGPSGTTWPRWTKGRTLTLSCNEKLLLCEFHIQKKDKGTKVSDYMKGSEREQGSLRPWSTWKHI